MKSCRISTSFSTGEAGSAGITRSSVESWWASWAGTARKTVRAGLSRSTRSSVKTRGTAVTLRTRSTWSTRWTRRSWRSDDRLSGLLSIT